MTNEERREKLIRILGESLTFSESVAAIEKLFEQSGEGSQPYDNCGCKIVEHPNSMIAYEVDRSNCRYKPQPSESPASPPESALLRQARRYVYNLTRDHDDGCPCDCCKFAEAEVESLNREGE